MSSGKDNRKSAFNLNQFYQDLQRVESSLGKGDNRKSITSPILKAGSLLKQQKSNTLSTFKKQLNNKQLTKAKINLDQPYQQKINKHQSKANESKFAKYRGLQMEQEKEGNSYDKIREKLQKWRKQQLDMNNESIGQLSKVNMKVQRSEQDQSVYSDFLQKTMQTPPISNHNTIHVKLLDELSKRDQIYQQVSKYCRQEKSYYKKTETDLSIKLEEHFREHKTMNKVIDQFKRICGLKITDLKQLYQFLREGNNHQEKPVVRNLQEELI